MIALFKGIEKISNFNLFLRLRLLLLLSSSLSVSLSDSLSSLDELSSSELSPVDEMLTRGFLGLPIMCGEIVHKRD